MSLLGDMETMAETRYADNIRRANDMTGAWRAAGSPSGGGSLFLRQFSDIFVGEDTNGNYLSGEVRRGRDGNLCCHGKFQGRRGLGRFEWQVSGDGSTFSGGWTDNQGARGAWQAVKQEDRLTRQVGEHLDQRRWSAGIDALAGVGCTTKYSAQGIPIGMTCTGPGGSEISVGSGGGMGVKPGETYEGDPDAPPLSQTVSTSQKIMYGVLGLSGLAAIAGIWLRLSKKTAR